MVQETGRTTGNILSVLPSLLQLAAWPCLFHGVTVHRKACEKEWAGQEQPIKLPSPNVVAGVCPFSLRHSRSLPVRGAAHIHHMHQDIRVTQVVEEGVATPAPLVRPCQVRVSVWLGFGWIGGGKEDRHM